MKFIFFLGFINMTTVLANAEQGQEFSKSYYLKKLSQFCLDNTKIDMVIDKATVYCRCYDQNILEVDKEEAEHLWLDKQGERKKSKLKKDVSDVLEHFEVDVLDKCKKDPNWRKKKSS